MVKPCKYNFSASIDWAISACDFMFEHVISCKHVQDPQNVRRHVYYSTHIKQSTESSFVMSAIKRGGKTPLPKRTKKRRVLFVAFEFQTLLKDDGRNPRQDVRQIGYEAPESGNALMTVFGNGRKFARRVRTHGVSFSIWGDYGLKI